MGDCLFALAGAARLLRIHPETALRRANEKFIERFLALEKRLSANGTPLGEAPLEEMETVRPSRVGAGPVQSLDTVDRRDNNYSLSKYCLDNNY